MRLLARIGIVCLVIGAATAASAQVVDTLSRNNAITHYRLGETLFRDEMFEQAAEQYQMAIKFDPLLLIAHYQLGQSYMALHRYREAIVAYLAGRDAFQTIAVLIAKNDVTMAQRRDDEIRELKETIDEMASQHGGGATSRQATVIQLQQRIADLERTRQRGPS